MFQIPDDLSVFSLEGLRDLRRVAAAELESLRASATPDTITDEQLERGEALAAFLTSADTEIGTRTARADRFNALPTGQTEPAPANEPGGGDDESGTGGDGGATTTAAATGTDGVDGGDGGTGDGEPAPQPSPDPAPAPRRVGVSQMAPGTELPDAPAASAFGDHTVVAAADIPGVSTGSEMESWLDVAKAFCNRTRAYSGRTPSRHSVVEIQRKYGDQFSLNRDQMRDAVAVQSVLDYVADESRLDGGSLLAANGWCAPSPTLYSTCNQIGTDGLVSIPEVTAPRGGINHNQGIEFDTVFGDGTGFTILTEDDVISGEVKTCVEIPCPPFVDDRLKVAALCLTGSILQNRAYPEFVSTFIQGAMAVQAHNVNRQIIADVIADSTAVDLSGAAPWDSDTSVVSQTLSAVEHAIVDIKYRLRLNQNTTLEVWLPFWVLAQYRADYIRRTGIDDVNLADARLASWFATRGARAQYLYDWQDAFADGGTGYGADSPLLSPPDSVDFVVYPAGTWVLARLDVIRLDSVYDSVNLPQNLVTQLFMEDGFAAMRMCPLSRVYTVPICPSGATSDLQTVCVGAS